MLKSDEAPGGMLDSAGHKTSRYRQTAVSQSNVSNPKRGEADKASAADKMWYIRDKMFEKQWGTAAMMIMIFIVVIMGLAGLHMVVDYEEGRTFETDGLCFCVPSKDNCQKYCTSFPHHLWIAWVYMADPGTHADASGGLDKVVSALISLMGIFFFATVFGFVVDAVRELMDTLNKGKSKVVESGHTLILGWTDRCPALIKEIALACESEGGGTICILAEQDKLALEAEMRYNLSKQDLRGLNVVFRNGSSMVMNDLTLVSACSAKNIIILAPIGMEADKADSVVLRTVLQLKGMRNELSGHIVAELRDVDNESLVQMVGMGSVESVVSHDIVGRLMLMAARQPGLASVYDAILGFEGDEFYLQDWPELHGVKFKELPLRFPHAVALGIKRKDSDIVELNPDMERRLGYGDELLVLAADDNSYSPREAVEVMDLGTVPKDLQEMPAPECILMCGWRRDVDDIIKELDNMVVSGSQLHMLCEVPIGDRAGILEKGGLSIGSLKNITIVHHLGNSAIRRQIEELPLEDYDSILILADEARESDMMHSDSHTLASLLLIRDIQNRRMNPVSYKRAEFLRKRSIEEIALGDESEPRRHPLHQQSRKPSQGALQDEAEEVAGCLSVCEVLDHRTRYTIDSSRSLNQASDFVQSNEFVSRVLAMVAEKREVKSVLDCLLGSTGTSLCVNSPIRYAHENERLSFYSMALRAQEYKEILCGYKKHGQLPSLNPKNKHEMMLWDDVELIVMSDPNLRPIHSESDTSASTSISTSGDNRVFTDADADKVDGVVQRVQQQLSALNIVSKNQVLENARKTLDRE